jgi:endonuclease III related protein
MKLLHKALLGHFGRLEWWPVVDRGNMHFEIILGAMLTQQAPWRSVETAIRNLTDEGIATPKALANADIRKIQKAIRPTGFYRQKAKRIKDVARHVAKNYRTVEEMLDKDTHALRDELLSLNGIGKETADDILLYAAGRAIMPIDAYTYRVLSRLGIIGGNESYDELQEIIHERLPENADDYKEFHALVVEHAKKFCRKAPLCKGCPISRMCRHA